MSFSSFAPSVLPNTSAHPGLRPWAAIFRRFAASAIRLNHLLPTMAVILVATVSLAALDRQPNADYHVRRQALAAKTEGAAVLLFASTESEGPNAVYGDRPDNNFFYLTGWSQPGAVPGPGSAGTAGRGAGRDSWSAWPA